MLMNNEKLVLCPRCNSPNIEKKGWIADGKGIGQIECPDCGLRSIIFSTVKEEGIRCREKKKRNMNTIRKG